MNNSGHFALTLNASVQQLSSAFVAGDPRATAPVTWVSIQAFGSNSNIVYVGFLGDVLSATNYGQRIEIPVSTVPAAPTIIENQITSLDQIVVLGTNNEKIAVSYARP